MSHRNGSVTAVTHASRATVLSRDCLPPCWLMTWLLGRNSRLYFENCNAWFLSDICHTVRSLCHLTRVSFQRITSFWSDQWSSQSHNQKWLVMTSHTKSGHGDYDFAIWVMTVQHWCVCRIFCTFLCWRYSRLRHRNSLFCSVRESPSHQLKKRKLPFFLNSGQGSVTVAFRV